MRHNYRIFGKKPIQIVIEMGLGSCISEWAPVAKTISKDYGVMVYERAGINHSAAFSEPRTPENIAKELYELLVEIPHTEQIVLLAHSQGGLYAQQYCRMYPELVSGLLLLDPLAASDYRFKEQLTKKEYKKSGVDKSLNFILMHRLATLRLGAVMKAFMKKAPPLYYYPFTKQEEEDILNCVKNPVHAKTAFEEYQQAHQKEYITRLSKKNDFPDIPLLLITHASEPAIQESMKFGNNSREFASKIEFMWQEIMKEYVQFSSRATWVQAEQSTHYIHLMEPQLVIDSLNQLLDAIQLNRL